MEQKKKKGENMNAKRKVVRVRERQNKWKQKFPLH